MPNKRDNSKSHVFQILHHLNCVPAVKANLPDIELSSQIADELFNKAVVDHVSCCRMDKALPLPDIIEDVIPVHSNRKVLLRNPEIRQDLTGSFL